MKKTPKAMLRTRKAKARPGSAPHPWWYIERGGISVYAEAENGRAVTGVYLTRRQLETALRVMREAAR